MFLCEICNAANGNAFESAAEMQLCHVCRNNAMKTDGMIDEAKALLSKEDVKSFSISTLIPKDWLIKEEDIWDKSMDKAESIKNYLNRTISCALKKSVAVPYIADGDCRVVFDYNQAKVSLERNELFIFGRYKKIAAGLSQSRWKCSKCDGKGCLERRNVPEHLANGMPFAKCKHCEGKGKFYESVEERIGEPVKKAAQADDYVMHASGREDVDATNSAGRAFVLEVKAPKKRELDLGKIANEIKAGNEVSADDLRIVSRSFVEVVTESHFDKSYAAEVEFGREITEKDVEKIEGLAGKTLLQQTPKRVAHRRADLVRHRKVKEIKVAADKNPNPKHKTIFIKAEAGTYIKELISGDGGRTEPSISGLLGTTALCKSLEVSEIDDKFLDFVLKD